MQLDEAIRMAQHSQSHDFGAQLVAQAQNPIVHELAQLAALMEARRLAEEAKAKITQAEARALNTKTRWDEAASQVRAEELRLQGEPIRGANYIGAQQQRNATLNLLRRTAEDRRTEHEKEAAYLQALRVLLDWGENLEKTWATAPTLRRILAELLG